MTSPRLKLVTGAAAILLCAMVFATAPGGQAQEPEGNFGVGIPEVFLPKYLGYRAGQLASGTPDVMRIPLGYVKGLSTSFTSMVGEAAINLGSGAFQVNLNGLTPLQIYTVWLVDGSETDFIPPVPDTVFGLVTFLAAGPAAVLTGLLPLNLPAGMTIDRVVVSPTSLFGSEALGAGTVNVFQKIFFRRLSLLNESTGAILFEETTPAPIRSDLVPDLAAETDEADPLSPPMMGLAMLESGLPLDRTSSGGSSGRSVKLDKLISQGAELFFEETFSGNGRTCGTCHRANRNFTIDAEFIATLPANDPLFVAEFIPALADLERPALMREFGLILENLDGFVPSTRFVMRGVPHTLGLQVSLTRDTSLPSPPVEMTGWSGDGAPVSGSLRDFAIGAVTQHFTKRLNRVSGTDFKLPKNHQLDALEAFQLSLGREKDFDLAKITFAINVNNSVGNPKNVNQGKLLFTNGGGDPNFGGTCNFCHTNAGALSAGLGNENRNFNTNVEDRPHPARIVQNFPIDGGFGRTNNGDGTFGNRTFNTASVVEAADTPPFFHNSVEVTLKEAVRFYTGTEFNNPRLAAARFSFTETQLDQITNFLRGVNTLQNIDVARRELQEILSNNGNPRREQDTRLQTAFEETENSIDVLDEGGIFPTAVSHLIAARNLISQAQLSNSSNERRTLIQQAIAKLGQAKNAVATIAP